MKFLLLLYDDVAAVEAMTPEERRAIVDEHVRFGRMLETRRAAVAGEALRGPETARTVRFGSNGAVTVTDGPYLETKEAIGGFYILECADEAEALELARQVPAHPASWPSCVPSPTSEPRAATAAISVRYRAPSSSQPATPR